MEIRKKTCLRLGVTAFLLFLAIHYWKSVAGLLGLLLGACVPLVLGGVIAYVINVLMDFYERHYFPGKKAGMAAKSRRPVCMLAAVLTVLLLLFLVVRLVLPEFLSCVNALVRQAPQAVNQLLKHPTVQKLIPPDIEQKLSNLNWNSLLNQVKGVLASGFTGAANAVSSIFSGAVTALFALIFAVYLLLGKDKLGGQCKRAMACYLPESVLRRVERVLALLNQSFRSYVVGQCTEAVILGCLCIGGMLLFRFPYATMIGTLVGVTALIPVAGAYIGAGVGAFMILSVSPEKAIWFLVFIVVLQQLEGNLIYPRVVGSSIGLPGIFVLAAVTVGGAMFGVLGMLAGVPLVAAAYQAIREDVARRERGNVPPPDLDIMEE